MKWSREQELLAVELLGKAKEFGADLAGFVSEIGRASCRERVSLEV